MKNLIFIVAYNHENFITSVLDRLPKKVYKKNYEILIIDDASKDKTFDTAIHWAKKNKNIKIKILKNPKNLGYGGNQKVGFNYAIKNNFSNLVLLHGDGQYAPEIVIDLVEHHIKNLNKLTLGSRMIKKTNALKGRMPIYKFIGNIILTFLQNIILSSNLSEFHTGYRVYNVENLKKINFHLNTNDYHFDTQTIIQFLMNNFKVGEYSIPTYYGNEISYVNGFKYAYNVIKESLKFKLQEFGIFFDKKYEINKFIQYEDKTDFLSTHYFIDKLAISNSNIIDLGYIESKFHQKLKNKNCFIKGVNKTKIIDNKIYDKFQICDLNFKIPKDIAEYDYILILDVIEHLYSPEKFIEQLVEKLNSKQSLIISTGNVSFFIVRIMLFFGYFNYGTKGILDKTHTRLFTPSSFKKIFKDYDFKLIKAIGVPAPYPLALGKNILSHSLLHINNILIKLFPNIFSYQTILILKPPITLNQLLKNTIKGK